MDFSLFSQSSAGPKRVAFFVRVTCAVASFSLGAQGWAVSEPSLINGQKKSFAYSWQPELKGSSRQTDADHFWCRDGLVAEEHWRLRTSLPEFEPEAGRTSELCLRLATPLEPSRCSTEHAGCPPECDDRPCGSYHPAGELP